MPLWERDPEDWEYFHHNPALKGIEFRSTGDGKTYELVFVRHPTTDPYHGTWYTFPHLREFSMNDIYSKHPTKPNLWLYAGRADDVIVFSNGEKFNPVSMETKLREHPYIKGVIIVGQGKFAAVAVIELQGHIARDLTTKEDRVRLIGEIWPKIVEANEAAPGHGQLAQDKIILAKPEKPFPRAGKGTVQRKMAVTLYQDEIEEIYHRSDEDDFSRPPTIDLDAENLEEVVRKLIKDEIRVEALPQDQDFFRAGMDSLHVMTIVKQLRAAVVGAPENAISSRLIYSNPTVSMLATALKNVLGNGNDQSPPKHIAVMHMLEKYLNQLPAPISMEKTKPTGGLTVILTGSTGSLGSYLLDILFSAKNVIKIYCINRRADAAEHQAETNAARGLASKWGDRTVFLHGDLSKVSFGLPSSVFESLRNEASVIIREFTHSSGLILGCTTYASIRQPMAC